MSSRHGRRRPESGIAIGRRFLREAGASRRDGGEAPEDFWWARGVSFGKVVVQAARFVAGGLFGFAGEACRVCDAHTNTLLTRATSTATSHATSNAHCAPDECTLSDSGAELADEGSIIGFVIPAAATSPGTHSKFTRKLAQTRRFRLGLPLAPLAPNSLPRWPQLPP